MNVRAFLVLVVVFLYGPKCLAQGCASEEQSFIATIRQQEKLPSGFTVRVAEVPSLEEAVLSIQVDGAQSQNTKVQEVKFCEISPFMFQLRNGVITGTSVELDSESTWLVGMGPGSQRFLLTGFADSLKGFNALVKTVGMTVQDMNTARTVFDLYLRLAAGQKFRMSVIADEMQLQSVGLSDFRLRYPLPRARTMYTKWWKGIRPAIKNELHRPEVTPEQNGFKVSYLRYDQGRVLHEWISINRNGIVTTGATQPLYVPSDMGRTLASL